MLTEIPDEMRGTADTAAPTSASTCRFASDAVSRDALGLGSAELIFSQNPLLFQLSQLQELRAKVLFRFTRLRRRRRSRKNHLSVRNSSFVHRRRRSHSRIFFWV